MNRHQERAKGWIVGLFLTLVVLVSMPADGWTMVDLCQVLRSPAMYDGKEITVRATVRPSMHGTYLGQAGCDEVLFVVVPTEIPNSKAEPEVEKDSNFNAFERARSDYRPEAAKFTAAFTGRLELAKHGKAFGYFG